VRGGVHGPVRHVHRERGAAGWVFITVADLLASLTSLVVRPGPAASAAARPAEESPIEPIEESLP
jgi:hypothetical protein